MYLIAGLGNPGEQYKNTRHNIGFKIIDLLSNKYNIELNRIKFKGVYGEGRIGNSKVILLKPVTYMNSSGESIKQAISFYKIPNENIIVVYDDISLEIGRLRIRAKGSAGGHNGIKSIINHLGSDEFQRIKVGVGQPKKGFVSHVLGNISEEEHNILIKVFEAAILSAELMVNDNILEAMNKYNGFRAE